jgi:uncharacterized protein with PQ loop repeat
MNSVISIEPRESLKMMFHPNLDVGVAVLTMVFGILVKVIGIPDQIRQNFKRKSTAGVSLPNQAVGFLAYFFWTFHGILRHDATLIYAQGLGVVTTGIVLLQFFLYRKRRNDASAQRVSGEGISSV